MRLARGAAKSQVFTTTGAGDTREKNSDAGHRMLSLERERKRNGESDNERMNLDKSFSLNGKIANAAQIENCCCLARRFMTCSARRRFHSKRFFTHTQIAFSYVEANFLCEWIHFVDFLACGQCDITR